MDKSQPNETKIKKDGTNGPKECLHGIVKEAPLKGILSRGKKKSDTKKKKKMVSFNEIPDVRVFDSDISISDSTDTACPANTSSDTACPANTSSDTASTSFSSASPTRDNPATVSRARGKLVRGSPVRLTPVRVSPTRVKDSPTRVKDSPTRAKASSTRAKASPTRSKANPARTKANPARTKVSHARARASTNIVSPASTIPASNEPSKLVMTPFSYRFPPPPEVTPEDTEETKLFMADLLKELDRNLSVKQGNLEYIKRNETGLANPSRRRPLPDKVGGGDPPPKKARKNENDLPKPSRRRLLPDNVGGSNPPPKKAQTLNNHESNSDDMATPFDMMVAMMPHIRFSKTVH